MPATEAKESWSPTLWQAWGFWKSSTIRAKDRLVGASLSRSSRGPRSRRAFMITERITEGVQPVIRA